MKSRITKTVALAALMAGTAGVANATEGWYGRADIGWSFDGTVESDDLGGEVTLEHDWTEHLGLGYAFGGGFRLEGELGHRFNQLDEDVVLDGDLHAWSAMANLFYDFNRGGALEPYIGAGVGAARLNGSATDGIVFIEGEDTVTAYQLMAGVAVGITEQLDLDVGFRHFVAEGAEFDEGTVTGEFDYEHQAITVGLRYQFAAPAAPVVAPPPVAPPVTAPPVAPPPVTCPTSEFVVYFEWDRSNLNQAALETIDAAVNRARQCNVGGVVVVGHTDTSGSPTYNQGLSERRASVVRDALVARGIAAGSITTQARGETELARATADGVREPLNRRTAVTITFR
ncbi:MAG TPA: outer membrane beta-barrel protein [Vitreimonas sp.]|uniref:OmpA family protein n=1 Tax=Vitreimonas sp. TaxID=3069702 RepID=UPI002D484DB5|nr:outer membrane beta-barrel protein [Vitreimonas sp.]HYD89239.1 outer membrane beta-barrel protein [Vitreimonas sp.]